jgi:multidrug efflux pump subunit AcrA (membrane-fusion protein)
MDDREYWTKQLREAEAELDAATRRSDVDAAAKRLQRAKAELKALEAGSAKRPKRSSRGSHSAGASS